MTPVKYKSKTIQASICHHLPLRISDAKTKENKL